MFVIFILPSLYFLLTQSSYLFCTNPCFALYLISADFCILSLSLSLSLTSVPHFFYCSSIFLYFPSSPHSFFRSVPLALLLCYLSLSLSPSPSLSLSVSLALSFSLFLLLSFPAFLNAIKSTRGVTF